MLQADLQHICVRPMKPAIVVLAAMISMALPAQTWAQNGELKFAELGRCKLENGSIIEHCRIGYRTFGTLDGERDNAILMPTWLYGTSADLRNFFGDPNSAAPSAKSNILVDTSRYFGIAIDALGDGISSSPSNSLTQRGAAFPEFSTLDMVNAEYRVVTEVLHLTHLHAVLGLSMGGEQTFAWSVAHPEFVDDAIPILGTPRLTPYDLEVKEIMLDTIYSDPDYLNGRYTKEPNLKLANLFGSLVVTTPDFRNSETTRQNFRKFVAKTESPLPIDANDRVWQLKAILHQDVIGSRSLAQAAHSTHARFLVIVAAQDHLVNPRPALDWAAALNAPTYVSPGSCAHLIMTCDAEQVSSRVRSFLETETSAR